MSLQNAKINLTTHALHYGTSAWEGIRVYNYRGFKLQQHCQRLIESAKRIAITSPYSAKEIEQGCQEVIQANNMKYGYLRPIIWKGDEELLIAGLKCSINAAIIGSKYFEKDIENRTTPLLSLTVSSWKKPNEKFMPTNIKTGGLYMMLSLIKNQAIIDGFDDAIMLDDNNFITEATTSNIFFIFDNDKIVTPQVNGTFLNGITRQTVIEILQSEGMKWQEMSLTLDDIVEAKAAFLTGTAMEIGYINDIYNPWKKKYIKLQNENSIMLRIREKFLNLTEKKLI